MNILLGARTTRSDRIANTYSPYVPEFERAAVVAQRWGRLPGVAYSGVSKIKFVEQTRSFRVLVLTIIVVVVVAVAIAVALVVP